MDEKPKQTISDMRKPIPMKPGSPERYDYEYKRKGTANIFAVEPQVGKGITKRRRKMDFATFVSEVLARYPQARKVHIILDNLNTHFLSSFTQTFGEDQAKSMLQKVEFHYTPKHASWLNIAEIEVNVTDMECTNRRFKDLKSLELEVNSWTRRRNRERRKIRWGFDKEKADKKLSKYYANYLSF